MAELKHDFRAGKMNKDLDERLVPNGEYRDAMNIEVSASEDSNIGAVQTTLGNTSKSATSLSKSFTVGSIANTTTNKIYWMLYNDPKHTAKTGVTRDMIVEYDAKLDAVKYVFVDIYKVINKIGTASGSAVKYLYIPLGSGSSTDNQTGIRKGMQIVGTFNSVNVTASDNYYVVNIAYDSATTGWKITLNKALQTLVSETITFLIDRTLNFNRDYLVTGINIVDDMLFWTDGNSEPKKININRSFRGTGGSVTINSSPNLVFGGNNFNYHTRLVIHNATTASGYAVATNRLQNYPIFTEEKHLTVLKTAPQTPLELDMSRTSFIRTNSITGVSNRIDAQTTIQFFPSSTGPSFAAGTTLLLTFNQAPDYRIGDVLIFTNETSAVPTEFTDHEVRARITQVPQGHNRNNLFLGLFEIEILSISTELLYSASGENFFCLLQQEKSIFEFKFPKFGYRYKYTDGEYSAFSPWSEVAFLPGAFDYEPKKGYNLGMSNDLKELKLKKYAPEPGIEGDNVGARLADVVEIDILYKESNSTNIYTVKTIKNTDPHPVWPDVYNNQYDRGEISIDSEMIHAVLPSDQFLRPFDAVPKKAKSQEIAANRLLYGNYTENYNYDTAVEIQTSLNVGSFDRYIDSGRKSVKSIRNYQVGIVYLDKYGRETPVLVGADKGFVKVDKVFCNNNTQIEARALNTPPTWAESFKFYVKEPSNEYYNLAMDRWFNAEDGNIWISFPSSERNKVDEQTFLILKKQHDSSAAVQDELARFKILAIDNEAPDFIKRNRRSLGFMQDNSDKTHIGNGGDGFPFPGFNYLEIPYGALNDSNLVDIDASGTVNAKSPHLKDDLYLKIHSTSKSSVEYQVNSITNTGQGGNYHFELDKPFGDDVEFTTTDGTYANRISGLRIELIVYPVENKPFFDGRFFVKIEHDTIVREKIIGKTADEKKVTYSARNVRYIKAVDQHPGYANQASGHANYQYDWIGFANKDFDEIYKNNNEGYDYWNGFIMENRNGNGSGFFIDDDTTNYDISNLGNGTHANKQWGDYSVALGGKTLVEKHGQHMSGYGSSGIIATASKGIYYHNNEVPGTRIDISWVGFNDEVYRPKSIDGVPTLWSTHGRDIQPEDYSFSKEFFAIGTVFRFASDPDETAYTILDYKHESGIRNFTTLSPTSSIFTSKRWNGRSFRDKWSLKVDPPIQRTSSGFYPLDIKHDGKQNSLIELIRNHSDESGEFSTTNPAVFETEPREDVGLDVYYEASVTFPTRLNSNTNEMFASIGSAVSIDSSSSVAVVSASCAILSWSDNIVTLTGTITGLVQNEIITFTRADGGKVRAMLKEITASTINSSGSYVATSISFYEDVSNQKMTLEYSNCFAFPQGIESDRIRDDFNQTTLGKGVKASTVLSGQYKEEKRSSGLIFSGIYNGKNSVNNLNQFISSNGITKDLNNQYGAIQKLFTRNNNIIAFCEDKVLKIYSKKDALYNADGNVNLVSTNRVLGTAEPYSGEYGISNHPESFAQENFRVYFADQARGAVLRLSKDGLTVVSSQGMKDYFRDNLHLATDLIGSYDKRKNLYNLTLHDRGTTTDGFTSAEVTYTPKINSTVSFSETSNGWTSFKSFIPESGLSLDNEYYTFKKGNIYLHHNNQEINNFYGISATDLNSAFSSVTVVLNEQPGSVKRFNTLNYEGTQSKIDLFQTVTVGGVSYNDGEFYNLDAKKGWYVDSLTTDLQTGRVKEFMDKEGKWFNYIYGEATTLSNLDSKEFSYQGIGMAESISHNGPSPVYGCTNSSALNYNSLATIDNGSCILIEQPTTIRFMWQDIISPCKPSPDWDSELNYDFTWSNTLANIPAPTSSTTISNNSFNTVNSQTTNNVSGETISGTYINPVYTKVIAANAGYMFSSTPSFAITINNANSSLTNYNVQQTNLVYDANQNLISATFTISFTMPSSAMSVNDDIIWDVCTVLIPTTNTSNFTLTVQDDPTDH